jgi:hypothetical protein
MTPRGRKTKDMTRYHRGRIAGARSTSAGLRKRGLPVRMRYVERISERVAWRACNRVRSLREVREACFEGLQKLFVRLCL